MILKKNKSNTSAEISIKEIIEIHCKLVDTYNNCLKSYGVKPLWNEGVSVVSESDVKNLNDKELQMIFLYKYQKCFVHKDLISEFVRTHKPNAGLDQQVRHLGTQNFWYVLNKGAKVPDSDEEVPSGYHYLVSTEMPNPKAVKMAFKRANRSSAKSFQELKWVYDSKCATCGLEEGTVDWRTGRRVVLQQGHMDPRKNLTLDNTIPQCEYCNQTYGDYFRFDENGRVVAVNNPEILLKSPRDIQDEMIKVLLAEKEKEDKKKQDRK